MAIQVIDYDPDWKHQFETLKATLWPAVSNWADAIEHVGSTSVVGLAAKPTIDIDIIVPDFQSLPEVVKALQVIGYIHRGNLGIEGRESFKTTQPDVKHNLYVCEAGCVALKNHLSLRDHLRNDAIDREAYSQIKKDLAERFSDDIDAYVEGKTKFITDILSKYDFELDHLNDIKEANKKK